MQYLFPFILTCMSLNEEKQKVRLCMYLDVYTYDNACVVHYYVQCFIKIWQLPPFDCLDDHNVVILKMNKT